MQIHVRPDRIYYSYGIDQDMYSIRLMTESFLFCQCTLWKFPRLVRCSMKSCQLHVQTGLYSLLILVLFFPVKEFVVRFPIRISSYSFHENAQHMLYID